MTTDRQDKQPDRDIADMLNRHADREVRQWSKTEH